MYLASDEIYLSIFCRVSDLFIWVCTASLMKVLERNIKLLIDSGHYVDSRLRVSDIVVVASTPAYTRRPILA